MKSILKFLPLVAGLTVVLFGCSRPINDFAFHAGGKTVSLHARRSISAGQQGEFLPLSKAKQGSAASADRTTVLYSLDRPETTTTAAGDFYLTYHSTEGPLTLHLYRQPPQAKTVDQLTLPLPSLASAADSEVKYLVPLPPGTRVTAFRVTSTSKGAGIAIRDAGLAADMRGVRYKGGTAVIRKGMSLEQLPSAPGAQGGTGDESTLYRFSDLTGTPASTHPRVQTQVVLTYTYSPPGKGEKTAKKDGSQATNSKGTVGLLVRDSAANHRRYLVHPRSGTHRLYLYTASCGFTPDSVEISSGNRDFRVDSLVIHSFPSPSVSPSFTGTVDPIPADFGAILDYSPTWWRRSDYEIFSWSLVPSVIVMEFRTYAIQARFMKRIAFFVEKRGYAGRLWTNSQLAGLHGWNAHDYRPEDLGRFFTTAAKEHFTLNPEEVQLRKILIANGLIVKSGSEYRAGKGAILTFAHVGPEWLRWLLLTHEGYHGIFFTHPAYRKAVFAIWDDAPQAERAVFRDIFLPYSRYDTTDDYLVKNEFQAYLMQQPIGALDGYFKRELDMQMRAMKIPSTSPLAGYIATHPAIFHKSAEEIQKAVEKAVGVSAGNLVGLQPE